MQNDVEERTDMTGTFPGRIVLVEGDEVDIDLQMGADKIRLATPFTEIGSWDVDSVEITPQSDGSFELAVAEDVVTFFPNDPSAFEAAIAGASADPETDMLAFPGQSDSVSPPAGDDWFAPDDSVDVPADTIAGSGSIDDLSAALEALRAEPDDVSDDEPDEGRIG